MDPAEALLRAARALEAGDFEEMDAAIDDYNTWRRRGGFEPYGVQYKEGTEYGWSGDQYVRKLSKSAAGRRKQKASLRRVPLNAGGYEYGKYGQYYGRGEPLYRFVSEDEEIDETFRAPSREEAKRMMKSRYPHTRFRGLSGTRRKTKCKYGRYKSGRRKGQCRTRRLRK